VPNKKLEAFRVGQAHDRRRRLTDTERAELIDCKGTMSQREAARTFGVSRRLVTFVWYPEKLQAFKVVRKGCWRNYYTTGKHREAMKRHREYKKTLMDNEQAEREAE